MNAHRKSENEEEAEDKKLPEQLFAAASPCTRPSWPGPRTVILHRTENGFGFTLRHFIVYPPEKVKAEKDAKNGGHADEKSDESSGSSSEPMDTIFVKQVKEGGPAHRAGLTTGDRIVSVNGETVTGKTYSDVVQLIQKKHTLQLLVVPREDDILQLYFPGTAYRCDVRNSGSKSNAEQMLYPVNSRRNFHKVSMDSLSSSDSLSGKNSASEVSMRDALYNQRRHASAASADSIARCMQEYGEHCLAQSHLLVGPTRYAKDGNYGDRYASFPFGSNYACRSEHHFDQRDQRNLSTTALSSLQKVWSDQSFCSDGATPAERPASDLNFETADVPLSYCSGYARLAGAFAAGEGKQQQQQQQLGRFKQEYVAGNNGWENRAVNPNWDSEEKLNQRVLLSVKQKEQFLLNSNCENGREPSVDPVPTLKHQLYFSPNASNLLKRDDAPSWSSKTPDFAPRPSTSTPPILHYDVTKNRHDENLSGSRKSLPFFCEVQQPGSDDAVRASQRHFENDAAQRERPQLTKVNSVPETGFLKCHDHVTFPSPSKNGISQRAVPALLRKANSLDSNIPPARNHNPHDGHRANRLHLVSDRAKLFESGTLELESQNRMNFYRNELCRLTTKCQTPSVFSRAAQFESLSSSQDQLSSFEERDSPQFVMKKCEVGEPQHGTPYKQNWFGVMKFQPADHRQHFSECGGPGMRDVHMGSPPPKLFAPTSNVYEQMQGNGVNEEDDSPRRKAVRQNSYLQAVHAPYKDAAGMTVLPGNIVTAVTVTNTTTSLTTTNSSKFAPTSTSESHFLCAGIVPERRAFFGDDRTLCTYAIPYSTLLSGSAAAAEEGEERQQKFDTLGVYTHNIQKLKAFFGEKTPHILEAAVKHRLKESVAASSKKIFKDGWLQCKIAIIEGKRSTDRSWKQFWATLRRSGLHMNKEKPQQYSSNGDEPSVVIHPVVVDVASNYTKRKNVFKVATGNNSEYLLQADDDDEMKDWIRSLQQRNEIEDCTAELLLSEEKSHRGKLSPQPVQKGIRKLTSFRNRSPTNHSPVIKSRKTVHGDESLLKSKTWKGKMVKTIRRIQGSSSASLVIPEDVTISVPLEDCPSSATNEYVPLIVELCISIIEARGLEMVGIYRVPGNTAAVTALLEALNRGFDQLNLQDPRWNDVNVISSVLKAFFRKLPDSLITSDLYPFFIAANKIEDVAQRLFTLKKLLHELPNHHYESIKFLIRHLRKVVSYSVINKMEARNLAIVFGPTLVRTADENMATLVTDMSHQCCIVETLINKAKWFFDDEHNFELSPSVLAGPANSYDGPVLLDQRLHVANVPKLDDVHAKDIISSIIAAANRKVWHKSQKLSVSSAPAESDTFEERNIDREVAMRARPLTERHGSEDFLRAAMGRSAQDDAVFQRSARENEYRYAKFQTAPTISHDAIYPWVQSNNGVVTRSDKIGDEVIFRTYAGLSANTQERIRLFEMETRALLERDLSRHKKENEQRLMERQRIEMEWQRAKRELEQDDPLDLLADNLSNASQKAKFSSTSSFDSGSNSSLDFLRNIVKSAKERKSSFERCHFSTHPASTTRLPSYFANRKARLNFKSLEKSFFYIDQSVDDGSEASFGFHDPSDGTPSKDVGFGNLGRAGSLESIESKPSRPPSVAKENKPAACSRGNVAGSSFGSLDSLHGVRKTTPCFLPEDDLLCSITSTLNQRLSHLKGASGMLRANENKRCSSTSKAVAAEADVATCQQQTHHFRDPSLHRCGQRPNDTSNGVPSCYEQNLNADRIRGENRVVSAPSRCTSERVEVHRDEHTLITATVSTTKQTVTSSATTAVITSTIVSSCNLTKPVVSVISRGEKPSGVPSEPAAPTRRDEEKDKKWGSGSLAPSQEKCPSGATDGQSSSRGARRGVHRQRRHTLGGCIDDAENSRLALDAVMNNPASPSTAWKRLRPCVDDGALGRPDCIASWLKRERHHRSFPNLTSAKLRPSESDVV